MTPFPAIRQTIGAGTSAAPAPAATSRRRLPPPAPLRAAGSPYVPVNPAAAPPETRSVEKLQGGIELVSPGAAALPAALATAEAAETQDRSPANPGNSPAPQVLRESLHARAIDTQNLCTHARTGCHVSGHERARGGVSRGNRQDASRGIHDDGGRTAPAGRVANLIHRRKPRTSERLGEGRGARTERQSTLVPTRARAYTLADTHLRVEGSSAARALRLSEQAAAHAHTHTDTHTHRA